MQKTLILIPSRLSAKRLPNKPLLKINGISIISHVYQLASKTNIGEVYVATEDKEIFDDVIKNGGKSILTRNDHKTGTDRIYEAYEKLNLQNVDYILNIQGDEPMLDKKDVINFNNKIIELNSDMGTLACAIDNDNYYMDKNIVKVKTKNVINEIKSSKAESFFRELSNDKKDNVYHHIGIYSYKVSILKKIVSLNQTKNEIKYKLEQVRALENNIPIDVILANSSPIGVDTQKDYMEIKKLMEYKS